MSLTIDVRGATRVGKSSLIKRYVSGQFSNDYVQTKNSSVEKFIMLTNYGNIECYFVDTCFSEELDLQIDACILMFDLTDHKTFDGLEKYNPYKDTDVPVVVCGNKSDMTGIDYSKIKVPSEMGYYSISAKSCYNQDKPLLWIGRKVFGKDFHFVEQGVTEENFKKLPEKNIHLDEASISDGNFSD